MKKRVLVFAFAFLALGAYHPSSSAVKASGSSEKETILFDITTEKSAGLYTIAFETDIELPSFANHSFSWQINGENKETLSLNNDSDSSAINLAWNGQKPGDGNGNGYRHFHLEAGTTMFTTDTANYVLRNDYNFWWTKHSAGNEAYSWVFQHGGNDAPYVKYEIPTLAFRGDISGGAQPGLSRWLASLPYEKGTWKEAGNSWAANAVYIDDGSGYKLYDYTYSAEGYLKFNDPISENAKGTVLTIIPFAPFNTETGSGLSHYLSFYFPKGTLLGGINEGYPFMVEEDAYFEISKEGALSGMYSTPHDYVVVPAACGHPGNAEYYTCSRHEGEIFLKEGNQYKTASSSEVLVDIDHAYEYVEEVPSTCDQDGVKAHYECSRCHGLATKEGDAYQGTSKENLIIKAAHKLSHVEEKPFTCSEDGTKAHEECSVCHKMYLQEDEGLVEVNLSSLAIPSHHVLREVEGKEATCLEEGKTSGKVCSVCGLVIEEGKPIAALGHRYSGWALQEDSLSIARYCLRCYESEEVALSQENGFTYKIERESTSSTQGVASYSSSKYGTFYVALPLKEKGVDQNAVQNYVAGGVAIVCVSLSIGGFFLLKKFLHL